MKKVVLSAIAAVAMVGIVPALAQTAAPVAAPGPGAKPLAAMTRAELGQKVQQLFARLDANKDGFVTQAEAQAHAGQRSQRMQRRAERRDRAAKFARIDANGDGQITRAEVDAARAARAQSKTGGTRARGMFGRADANRDGAVSRAELDAARARMPRNGGMRAHGFGGRLFAMADADKDGRVSLQEATAVSMQHFDSADANRDGTVTLDERRQMRQHRRGAAPRR